MCTLDNFSLYLSAKIAGFNTLLQENGILKQLFWPVEAAILISFARQTGVNIYEVGVYSGQYNPLHPCQHP